MQGLTIRQKANLYKATLNEADLTGAYVYDAIMPNGIIHVVMRVSSQFTPVKF